MSSPTDAIIDVMWDETTNYNGRQTAATGKWTEPVQIPDGQYVVGLKTNTEDVQGIQSLAFLTTTLN